MALLALLIVVVGGAYAAGHAHSRSRPAAARPGTDTASDITWVSVGPWPVPRSATAGPARVEGQIASGFVHSALGAGVAAWNIAEQMSSDAGPAVYTATVRDQTFGDPDVMLSEIERMPTGGSAPGTDFFYKIAYGDPTGTGQVLVSIANRTPSSAQQGGYFALYTTLRWINGDWRMQVPIPYAQLITDVSSYQPLGGPHV